MTRLSTDLSEGTIIVPCDFVLHADQHPFCDDETCPCHEDEQSLNELLSQPVLDGVLTADEAHRLFTGRQV